jgi:hypothetical protein
VGTIVTVFVYGRTQVSIDENKKIQIQRKRLGEFYISTACSQLLFSIKEMLSAIEQYNQAKLDQESLEFTIESWNERQIISREHLGLHQQTYGEFINPNSLKWLFELNDSLQIQLKPLLLKRPSHIPFAKLLLEIISLANSLDDKSLQKTIGSDEYIQKRLSEFKKEIDEFMKNPPDQFKELFKMIKKHNNENINK